MNTPIFCALALLAADPSTGGEPSFDHFSAANETHLVIRGQDSPFFGGGGSPPTYAPPGTAVDPSVTPPAYSDPFGTPSGPLYGVPSTGDPFVGGGAAATPYGYSPFSPQQGGLYTFGLNGPQPFQYGWQARYDFGYLTSEGTSAPVAGSLSIFEADFEKELTTPLKSGHTLSIAPQFNYRAWEGPVGDPAGLAGLPGAGYRFGLGLKLLTQAYGPWQFEVGFNPAIASDFHSGFSSDAVLFDGHVAAFWRTSPHWLVVIGAAYWDRVDDIVLPYAGVVWTPNDYWEFRLLFPKPRISWFAGTPYGVPTWLYAAGEFHVEAYELNVDGPVAPFNVDTRTQFADWRILGGVRSEFAAVSAFLEAGLVFERDVEFDSPVGTDFDIDDGFIVRAGVRY